MSWYVNTWNHNAVGPFDTAEAAAAWGSDHMEDGVLTLSRLTDPKSIARPEPAASPAVEGARPAEPSPELLQPNDGTAA